MRLLHYTTNYTEPSVSKAEVENDLKAISTMLDNVKKDISIEDAICYFLDVSKKVKELSIILYGTERFYGEFQIWTTFRDGEVYKCERTEYKHSKKST